VLLLHGWLVPSDPHWFRTFTELYEQGWRVIALDARGHGRGLRPAEPFRLEDCAADAAALIQYLECGPVIVVGYSMGGLIAQILARRRLDLVSGLVLCATAMELRKSLYLRMVWQGMGVFQWFWRLAPQPAWDVSMQMIFRGDRSTSAWAVGELRRGAAWDIGEAGREIGRFDSRPWIDKVHQPTAVVLTTLDLLIPPSRQRDLAACLHAPVVEVQADHMAPVTTPRRFHRGLSRALDLVEGRLTEDARPSLRAVGGAGRPA
jgi:3-oxoadipate enol-lactonase